jgi:hypothetical protein
LRHIENPFEKALHSSAFSRGLFTAAGSLCRETKATRSVYNNASLARIHCGQKDTAIGFSPRG